MSTTVTDILTSLTAQASAGAIKNKANAIQAKTLKSPDAEAHRLAAAALSNLQDQMNSQNKAMRSLATIVSNSSGGTVALDNSVALLVGGSVTY